MLLVLNLWSMFMFLNIELICWNNVTCFQYWKKLRYLAYISFLRNVCVEVLLFCMMCLCRSSSMLHYFLCEFLLLNIFPVWNLHLSQLWSFWISYNAWHKFCIYTQKPWHENAAFWHIFWPYSQMENVISLVSPSPCCIIFLFWLILSTGWLGF